MKSLIAALLALGLLVPAGSQAQIPGLRDLTDMVDKVKKTTDDTARVVKGVSGLSLEEEVAIGDAVALTIVGNYGGVWRDEAATRRVNLVGGILAQYATRQDVQWRFGLLDSTTVNAFSAPGGRVFITRGLYELPLSDAELAGVLAHEIMHIDERHAIDIIARSELVGGVSSLVADNNADFAAYESLVGEAADIILVKGFDPKAEYEADAGGRNLAAVTGYAPGGLRAVLTRIGASVEMAGNAGGSSFSTHPSTADRLQRLPADPAP
jgi:predicted Zn-dependent protease